MRLSLQRNLNGQTALGLFSNLLDADDRWACQGWYLAVHLWRYRLTVCGKDRA